MRKRTRIFVCVLSGLIFATPVWAEAKNACLQHNRAKNWRAVDEKTIVYMDRTDKAYTVTFRDACRNLTRSDAVLVNRHWSGLKCLTRGDGFRVVAHGTGAATCRVDTVHEGAPGGAAG